MYFHNQTTNKENKVKFKDKQEVPREQTTAPVGKVITEADLDKQIQDYQNQLVQIQTQAVAVQGQFSQRSR